MCGSNFIFGYQKFSTWPGIRPQLDTVMENLGWHLGNGSAISFWSDRWLITTILESLDIPQEMRPMLKAKVSDFIFEGPWNIPMDFQSHYPEVVNEVTQVVIPKSGKPDKAVWFPSISGELSFREAFSLLQSLGLKILWHDAIPHLRSFLFWKFILGRVSSDEELHK